MANRRIHDLEDTATTLDSGAYIAVDSDSYTAAKKFAADSLQTAVDIGDLTPTDGNFIVGNGSAWVAESGATARTSLGLGTMATEATTSYLAVTGATTGATSSAQTFTNGVISDDSIIIDVTNTEALLIRKNSDSGDVFVVDTTNKRVGIGIAPSYSYHISAQISGDGPGSYYQVQFTNAFHVNPIGHIFDTQFTASGTVLGALISNQFYLTISSSGSVANARVSEFFLNTGSSGAVTTGVSAYIKTPQVTGGSIGTNTGLYIENQNVATTSYAIYTNAGKVRFGDALTVIQDSATAAIPVLTLQQDDDSEDMIEFTGTVGTGNAIEAVGGKTLTTTHFIKCTITGVGTVYFPVGTIA